ncbi:LysR substrate-binding domain-containing protein [Methylobacterium sp. JK268]
MVRVLPPLSALKAFEATARLGSVGRAALELGRTHGAISRQLRTLQDQAGIALFEKEGTGLRLSRQGEVFHRVVAGAFDDLERGYRQLQDDARGAVLHVVCSATFAVRWLVPRLADLDRQHPGLSIRLSMLSPRESAEDADLFLTWDRLAFPLGPGETRVFLADTFFGPVCAPGYPVLRSAEGLAAERRIVQEHASRAWDAWQDATGCRLATTSDLLFPHTNLCIEAAAAGMGVALVEARLVRQELESGRLVALWGWLRVPDGLAVRPASARGEGAAGRAFVAWLKRALASEPGPAGQSPCVPPPIPAKERARRGAAGV